MAIVLEVSLTLNPNNQIAYLADFTSLQEDTEYVITGTYLNYDTRFVFHGFFDITLTKPPIGVPASGTIVPAEISTVPAAAPAPIPATYPYSVNERIIAANLNAELEFNPATVPPHGNLGGAGKFKYWVDTSTPMPSLRQCVVPRASPTYNAAEWLTLGTIDAAAGKFHFNGTDVDFVGGEGGGTTIFNVTNLTVQGNTNLTTLVVTGTTNLTTLTVSGSTTLGSATVSSLNVTGALTGVNETLSGDLTALGVRYTGLSGNRIAFSWDGRVEAYVDGVFHGSIPSSIPLPISEGGTQATTAGQGLANLGGFPNTGGTITGSLGVTGNLQVNGNINCSRLDADYIYSRGNMAIAAQFNSNTVYTNYLNSAGGCDVAGTVGAGGFSTGGNIHAGSDVNGNTGTFPAYVSTSHLWGGYGNAGALQMWNSGNRIVFKWDGGVSNGGAAAYRVDEAVEKYMCTTANVFDVQYAYPGGGPTSAVMGGHDVPGTWYYSFIDYISSDERIKDNIADTEVDALAVLQAVPVSKFDVKGAVAAWHRNIGMDTQERIASMRGAAPVHVPIGFVAQRVQEHIPDAVMVARQDGAIPEAPLPVDTQAINRQEFIPYLVRAIQQLAERVEQLEA